MSSSSSLSSWPSALGAGAPGGRRSEDAAAARCGGGGVLAAWGGGVLAAWGGGGRGDERCRSCMRLRRGAPGRAASATESEACRHWGLGLEAGARLGARDTDSRRASRRATSARRRFSYAHASASSHASAAASASRRNLTASASLCARSSSALFSLSSLFWLSTLFSCEILPMHSLPRTGA